MNSESEGKAAHVAEWMTNHPQQTFDHSDSFNNIPKDYNYIRTDRRRSSKRRSRRRRHRNYGQADSRRSRRTEPNSHSEYYSYQSNQSKKYRRRTDGSSSSCNDKIPRSHLRRTNYHDVQSEYEEMPHITSNRLSDNRGFPPPTETMRYEDYYGHPTSIYIQDRQPVHDSIPTNGRIAAIYDDRQCESNNDHGRMHLHPNIFHPAINSNPIIHHSCCDGCNSSHAGGSSNHASHGYFRPHYQHCIADGAYPVFESDSHHTQYARNYQNSSHVIRVTIPPPKDNYFHQQQQQPCTMDTPEAYYVHSANQDGSPIEPTTTPAGHGQLPLNYSHEPHVAIADQNTSNTPIDNNNSNNNNNDNNNNRQFNTIPTPESNTEPHMADYDRNYGSDYDTKHQSDDEKPTDSIDMDNMSRQSRLSPPEADDYKRMESRA